MSTNDQIGKIEEGPPIEEKSSIEKEDYKILPQIQAIIIANLTLLTCGISYAWPTPSLPKLEGKSSDLHLTSGEGAWVVTALPLGSIFGPILSALLLDHIGRKWFLYLTSVPFIICWVLTFFAESWIELLVARLFSGLSIGALYAVVPIYLGEIVETKIRGAASAVMPVMLNLGALLVYGVGPIVNRKAKVKPDWKSSLHTYMDAVGVCVVGCCSHVAMTLWYFGFARFQPLIDFLTNYFQDDSISKEEEDEI